MSIRAMTDEKYLSMRYSVGYHQIRYSFRREEVMKTYLTSVPFLFFPPPKDSDIHSLMERERCKRHSACWLSVPRKLAFAVVLIASSLFVSANCAAQSHRSTNDQVQVHLRLAQKYLATNTPDLAVKEFNAILAINPNDTTALANLGAIAFLQGDCRSAVTNFRRALKIEPSLNKAKALLAICEWRLGNPSAQSLLQASFAQTLDKTIRTQVGIELASSYYAQGDLEHTSNTLGALLQIDPDNVDVLYMAQRIYLEMAGDTLNKLAIIAPHSARMQQAIAERLINSGDVAGALEHYRSALAIDPILPGVHFEIGECILQKSIMENSLADSEKEFSEAIKADGDSAAIEDKLGMIASLRSRFDEAYVHYERAYTFNPYDTDAQLGIASVLIEMQKTKDAIPYLRKVVASDPMNATARYRLAIACSKIGLSEEANQQMILFRQSKALHSQIESLYQQMGQSIKTPLESKPAD
jgi:tetratricopeptide (TPR) repeat protein